MNEITKFIHAFEKESEEKRVGFVKMQKRIFESIVIELCRYYNESDKPKSKVLMNISSAIDYMEKNYTQTATNKILAEMMKVLNYLMKNKINTVDGVGKIIAMYYASNKELMELIRKNKVPEGIGD